MPRFTDRLQHAWNAFVNPDSRRIPEEGIYASSLKPDRIKLTRGNERSIITAIYNRIALDVAAIKIQHVRLDENDRYVDLIDDSLNQCLTVEANKDQTARAFLQDVAMSLLDEGCVAIIPVDTKENPNIEDSFKIESMRTAKVVKWYPNHVRVLAYNDRIGRKEEVTFAKSAVAIIENPLYAVMNEPNSTLQRLIRKLNLLDLVDEQSSSGKLDIIIQLPYIVKSEARKQQAEQRRRDLEAQLSGSKYGIAYTDGTEKITQLNRSLENNLLKQIEYLTELLYSQLGLTKEILNGTAEETVMLNYYDRTVEPIVAAIVDEMKRKFLTKTARTQRQSIKYFRDPFKLIPVTDLAEIADKFTRNEIMTSNELRQVIGMRPSQDPEADVLRNKNLNKMEGQAEYDVNGELVDEGMPAEGDPNMGYDGG